MLKEPVKYGNKYWSITPSREAERNDPETPPVPPWLGVALPWTTDAIATLVKLCAVSSQDPQGYNEDGNASAVVDIRYLYDRETDAALEYQARLVAWAEQELDYVGEHLETTVRTLAKAAIAMRQRESLLCAAIRNFQIRVAFIGHPGEPKSEDGTPSWKAELDFAQHALDGAVGVKLYDDSQEINQLRAALTEARQKLYRYEH